MEFRLAVIEDLENVKSMYRDIVKNMYSQNLNIWDDVYPGDFLEDDIKKGQLYILVKENIIVASFVLCDSSRGADKMKWFNTKGKALYLDRLGVNVNFLHKGIGTEMIEYAKKIARSMKVDYLRLFVVDENIPAINLYKKSGFAQIEGLYKEIFDDGFYLTEYGYETMLYVEGEDHSFEDLQHIVHTLRDKESGCSWDSVQTHESMEKCLRDETEEVIQAIENKDDKNLCEELGDILLQVLLHADIANDRGAFSFDEVVQMLSDKMIRRHPHVFGDRPRPETPEDALVLWKEIKEIEKNNRS